MTGRSGKLSCVAGAGSNELTDAPAPGAQSDGIRPRGLAWWALRDSNPGPTD